jgi:hypothetical protein
MSGRKRHQELSLRRLPWHAVLLCEARNDRFDIRKNQHGLATKIIARPELVRAAVWVHHRHAKFITEYLLLAEPASYAEGRGDEALAVPVAEVDQGRDRDGGAVVPGTGGDASGEGVVARAGGLGRSGSLGERSAR